MEKLNLYTESLMIKKEINELSHPYFVQLTASENDEIVKQYGSLRQALMQFLNPVIEI